MLANTIHVWALHAAVMRYRVTFDYPDGDMQHMLRDKIGAPPNGAPTWRFGYLKGLESSAVHTLIDEIAACVERGERYTPKQQTVSPDSQGSTPNVETP